MIIFQRNGSEVLEKDASELEETHIHNGKPFFSKYSEKQIWNYRQMLARKK